MKRTKEEKEFYATGKGQLAMYHDTLNKEAEFTRFFIEEFLTGPNPLTDDELRALIERRPSKYSKFSHYIGTRDLVK